MPASAASSGELHTWGSRKPGRADCRKLETSRPDTDSHLQIQCPLARERWDGQESRS
jgi:hypothetical protein